MDTMFMNSENSKISDPHRLLLNLLDKIDLKRRDKYAAPSNLSIYYTWKKVYMKNLNYWLDHILYQIFRIIFNISLKSMEIKQAVFQ